MALLPVQPQGFLNAVLRHVGFDKGPSVTCNVPGSVDDQQGLGGVRKFRRNAHSTGTAVPGAGFFDCSTLDRVHGIVRVILKTVRGKVCRTIYSALLKGGHFPLTRGHGLDDQVLQYFSFLFTTQ